MNTDPIEMFLHECTDRIEAYPSGEIGRKAAGFMVASTIPKYSYNFSWLGRPIIQYPQDMIAVQEIIWTVKPDLIIETGIAHGGSLIMSASLLALLDYCEAVESGAILNPRIPRRRVLGIDIDIRAHNRAAIDMHPLSHRIDMIQGSSIAPETIAEVQEIAKNYQRVLVCLDSNHTHEHVLTELEAYAPLTSQDSYCVVFDTIIEDMPDELFPDRPWGKGNNPKTAVWEYLRRLQEEGRHGFDGKPLNFSIDKLIENKLLITVAPDGYLKRIC
ncbi:MAG: cephalosporin hydroxylase family protein [Candidatus Methylumidiphilus sp.]